MIKIELTTVNKVRSVVCSNHCWNFTHLANQNEPFRDEKVAEILNTVNMAKKKKNYVKPTSLGCGLWKVISALYIIEVVRVSQRVRYQKFHCPR